MYKEEIHWINLISNKDASSPIDVFVYIQRAKELLTELNMDKWLTRNILRCTPLLACLNPELTSQERLPGCMAGEPQRWVAALLTPSGSSADGGGNRFLLTWSAYYGVLILSRWWWLQLYSVDNVDAGRRLKQS